MMRRRSKIAVKMIGICMLVIVFVLCGSSIYAQEYVTRILQKDLIDLYSSSLYQSALQISSVQEDILQFGTMVMANENVQKAISPQKTMTPADYALQRFRMFDILGEYAIGKASVLSIDIVLPDGKVFTSSKTNAKGTLYTVDSSWVEQTRQRSSGFSPSHYVDASSNGKLSRVFTWYKRFNNYVTTQPDFATIYIHFDAHSIEQFLQTGLPEYEWMLLCNEAEEILYSSNHTDIDLGSLSRQNSFEPYYQNSYTVTEDTTYFAPKQLKNGWSLLVAVPNDNIKQKVGYISIFFTILMMISILAGSVLLIIALTQFTKPIRLLTETAKKVSGGDLSIRAHVASRDEIGVLSHVFNNMLENLQEQMKQLVQMERTKTELKMSLLIAQINPHFIYNTLDSAIYLIDMNKNAEAGVLCRSFVKLLQNNLKNGPDGTVVSIAEELENIADYLNIQQIRYPNRFEVRISSDEASRGVQIPRMLLQPLVENALFHGVLPEEEKGRISLSVTQEQGFLKIAVSDNGIGMNQQQIQQLFEKQAPLHSTQLYHIGFYNVYERLQLVYKDKFSMDVLSGAQEGTTITIRLPRTFNGNVSDYEPAERVF